MATVATVMVDTSGRMVIPSKVRQELGIESGGELVVTMENGRMQLFSKVSGRQAARQAVRKLVPTGASLADELSAERRNDASGDASGLYTPQDVSSSRLPQLNPPWQDASRRLAVGMRVMPARMMLARLRLTHERILPMQDRQDSGA